MWSALVLQFSALIAVGAGIILGLDRDDVSGWGIFAAWLLVAAAVYGSGLLVEDVHALRERLASYPGQESNQLLLHRGEARFRWAGRESAAPS